MADYYPLLARALDALPDRSPAMRRAVYDRARDALLGQLRSLEPPLAEADIDLERRALDKAIERLEIDHGGVPAPANDVAVAAPGAAPASGRGETADPAAARRSSDALPEPAPPQPAGPEPTVSPTADGRAREDTPALPSATFPSFAGVASAPADEIVGEPPVALSPARTRAPARAPDREDPNAAASVPIPTEGNGAAQRPRIAVVAPRGNRSKALRNAAVGGLLILVIGLIAVAAFLLRDRPLSLEEAGLDASAARQSGTAESKFRERVGGEPAASPPGATRERAGRIEPATPSVAATAQRATLIEEASGSDGAQPATSIGRVTWRLDTTEEEQGQSLQNSVVAVVTYPEAGLTLTMTIQRNTSQTLAASHLVSLSFAQTGAGVQTRAVQDIGLLQTKDEEGGRGAPVSGLPYRVKENLFLIGLSSLPSDLERNTELLRRPWFDVAVRYTSGRRAVLTFEKGTTGAQVMQQALDAWRE